MQELRKILISGAAIILLVLGGLQLPAVALDVNGMIHADSRWTTTDSPVTITGNVRVAEDAALTIDPGVEVVFQSSPDVSEGFSIRIDGTLVARGSESQPIVFTAADRSIPWGAIKFHDTSRDWDPAASAGSVMSYCVLEYGGNEADGGGMISTFNAMPLITRNAIRFSDAAGISAIVAEDPALISSLSGAARIVSNLIYGNAIGIRLAAEGGIVRNNYFLNNTRAVDARVRSNDVTFVNNTVFSSAPELFGTGLRFVLDERASGIARYQWEQTAGTPVILSNPQSPRTGFTAPDIGNDVGTLVFELTVWGKDGGQSRQNVAITVIGDNPPPVAEAGADANVQLAREAGETVTVTLDAGASSSSHVGIAGYAWEQTGGRPVFIVGANSITPEFTVPNSVAPGDVMTFQLTVTNQAGLTDTDTVRIRYYRNNIYPAADAGEDQTVEQGAEVSLDGSGSGDPDGFISAYAWVQTGGPAVELVDSNTARPDFFAPGDNPQPETLVFQLQVTDNGDLQDTDEVSITVNSSLVADAGADRTVSAGDQVVLDGSGSVDHTAVANINIETNSFKMENSDAGLLAFTADEAAAFNLNVSGNRLEALGNDGYLVYAYNWSGQAPQTLSMPYNYWGSEDSVIIDSLIYDSSDDYTLPAIDYQPIAAGDLSDTGSTLPYPPLADAGPDLESGADEAVTLDGSSSYDPDGIVRYQWEQIDGPAVALKSGNQPVAEFIAPSGGEAGDTLHFRLTVATGPTFSHSDTVAVALTPAEPLPTVDVGGCFIQSAGSEILGGIFSPGLTVIIALCMTAGIGFSCRRRICRCGRMRIGLLLAALVLTAIPARAGYFAVGGGAGGDAEEVNVTVETGAKDIRAWGLNLLFGVGLHLIPHSDNELPSETIALPCPNEDCIPMENVRKGTEVGMLGKLGVEIASSDFYVSAIGGFSAFTESELSQSPATGRAYEDDSETKLEALYGGGVSYFMDFKWDVVLQVDYDNIRGVTGSVGWHW